MKKYESHPCTANMLDELLNDKDAEGFDAVHFIPAGAKIQENALMPNRKTAMPVVIVVFKRRSMIDA